MKNAGGDSDFYEPSGEQREKEAGGARDPGGPGMHRWSLFRNHRAANCSLAKQAGVPGLGL